MTTQETFIQRLASCSAGFQPTFRTRSSCIRPIGPIRPILVAFLPDRTFNPATTNSNQSRLEACTTRGKFPPRRLLQHPRTVIGDKP